MSEAPVPGGERVLWRLTSLPERGSAVLLVVRDSLQMTDREEFLSGCRELLASGQPRLVIDLRSLRRVFSVFVGSVMDVNARAQAEGRSLTLLASESVAALFRAVVGAEALRINDDVDVSEEERARRKNSSRRRSST